MTRLTIYRAANDTSMERGTASFAECIEVARAYQDNPNFGGANLYTVTVDIADGELLDLTDRTPRWLRERIEAMGGVELAWAITAPSTRIYRDLMERGYRWVRFADDYPEGAITTARIVDGDSSDDDLEQAMTLAD